MIPASFTLRLLILVLLFGIFFPGPDLLLSAPSRKNVRIIAVNDGDTVTVIVHGKKQRCRLIGIDAPERGQEPWGVRAREHLRKLLKDRRWQASVETGLEPFDKYNRLLVYLWTSDNRLINEQMLLDGYAVLFTYQPNSKYAERFAAAQRLARERKNGIWGKDGLSESPLDYKKKHPHQ